MNDALNFIYSSLSALTSFVFNQMIIVEGVTVGWVIVVMIVFGIIISNILNLPKGMGKFSQFRGYETVSTSHYDADGNKHTYWRRYRQ